MIPTTFTLTVAEQAGQATWLGDAAEFEWVQAPYVAGAHLIDVWKNIPNEANTWIGTRTSINGATNYAFTWTGAVIDQTLGTMIIANPGGHAGNWLNASYELLLNQAFPTWRRLTVSSDLHHTGPDGTDGNPTDWAGINTSWIYPANDAGYQTVGSAKTVLARHRDGRPRADHNCNTQQFVNGKVWNIGQSAASGGSGTSSRRIFTLDVAACRAALPSDSDVILPRPADTSGLNDFGAYTAGPYSIWATPIASTDDIASWGLSSYAFGCTVLAKGRYVWLLAPGVRTVFRIDTQGADAAASVKKFTYSTVSPPGQSTWAIWVDDGGEGYIIYASVNSGYGSKLFKLDLADQSGSTLPATQIDCTFDGGLSEATYVKKRGAVLHGSHIYTYDESQGLRRIQLGAWNWSAVATTGVAVPDSVNQGWFSRFNRVTGIDPSGRAVLVAYPRTDGPVYACRLP